MTETVQAARTEKDARYQSARKATLISVVVNVVLSIGKIIAGLVGNSAAMLADGIHSTSDLVTDGIVLAGMNMASRKPDEDHPYGHGKYETLASQFIAIILLAIAIGICIDAVGRMGAPDLAPPTYLALIAAVISLVSKEVMFQYTYRLGKKLNAKALIANAWHHRSDAISSIAALVGIGGAMLGWPVMDPLAAIAVAIILGKVGLELLRDAIRDLSDSSHAVDQEVRTRIERLVAATPDVRSAHCLTQRGLGPDVAVDVHVVVDSFLSVSEGHQIAETVRRHLIKEVEPVTEVMVHVDTEDDQKGSVLRLASRNNLIAHIYDLIDRHSSIRRVGRITPHYFDRGIILDLVIEVADDSDLESLRKESQTLADRLVETEADVVEVRISIAVT